MEPKAHARLAASTVATRTCRPDTEARLRRRRVQVKTPFLSSLFFGSCGFQTRKQASSVYSGLRTRT